MWPLLLGLSLFLSSGGLGSFSLSSSEFCECWVLIQLYVGRCIHRNSLFGTVSVEEAVQHCLQVVVAAPLLRQ